MSAGGGTAAWRRRGRWSLSLFQRVTVSGKLVEAVSKKERSRPGNGRVRAGWTGAERAWTPPRGLRCICPKFSVGSSLPCPAPRLPDREACVLSLVSPSPFLQELPRPRGSHHGRGEPWGCFQPSYVAASSQTLGAGSLSFSLLFHRAPFLPLLKPNDFNIRPQITSQVIYLQKCSDQLKKSHSLQMYTATFYVKRTEIPGALGSFLYLSQQVGNLRVNLE